MKKRVFIDMDGTLYRFHDHIVDESGHVQIEKMYEPDFFIKLDPFENMKDAINLLYSVDKEEVEIFVLSSADIKEVVEQKNYCLDRDFPFIDEEHRLFPKTWESKTEKIPEGIRVGDILIDDYNVNLEQWKDKGGASIKFVNNINHQGKGRYGGDVGNLWEHEILRYDMKPKDIVLNLEEIIGIQRDRFLFRFPDEEKNKGIMEKVSSVFNEWNLCEHDSKVYLVFTGDLEESITFDYEWMIKNMDAETIEDGCFSSYAEALYNWIDSVIQDIRDLGVWNEEKGHDFYLSVEEIEYCGLKEIYQDEKDNDLEMMEEMDEIDK